MSKRGWGLACALPLAFIAGCTVLQTPPTASGPVSSATTPAALGTASAIAAESPFALTPDPDAIASSVLNAGTTVARPGTADASRSYAVAATCRGVPEMTYTLALNGKTVSSATWPCDAPVRSTGLVHQGGEVQVTVSFEGLSPNAQALVQVVPA